MAPKEKKEDFSIEDIRDYAADLIEKHTKILNLKVSSDDIEEGIYQESGDEFNITNYSILLVKILENIKIQHVQEQLRNGIWKASDLAKMDKDILNPEKWQRLQDCRLPKNVKQERKKGTNRCPRCKSFYTSYTQFQSRSADEGMTVKNTCSDCDFVWKF
jgi:DNA-directed RNA polymerase subunit M/transcription elongation factor TFIIS